MDPYLCSLIDQLEQEHTLSASQWIQLLNGRTPELAAYLFEKSRRAQIRFYGHTVYIRGLIEFTNYCKNNCYYCGIRSGNTHAHRYRLTKRISSPAVRMGTNLDFVPLSCKAEKIHGIQRIDYPTWSTQSAPCTRTVPSHFLPEKQLRQNISSFLMQALTVSFCAMRPTMQTTTNSCIRRVYWHPTDSNVSGT